MALKQNPRLIQLNKEVIWELAVDMCKVLQESMSRRDNKRIPISEDFPARLSQTYDYVIPRTKAEIELRIFWSVQELSYQESVKLREGSLQCPSVLMGGALEVMSDVPMRDVTRSHMHLYLCPSETPESLIEASKKLTFVKRVYSTLLHEITHASEWGKAEDYPEGYGTAYLNHEWEVRANARQIAEEVVQKFRDVSTFSKRPASELLDSILSSNSRFARIYPQLTDKNKRKLLQYVAREVEEFDDVYESLE